VSKLGLFFLSLVAAIPGGFLAVRLVLDFLNRADQMETTLQIVSGLTLAMSALVMLLPFGILIFGPKTEKEPEVGETSKAEGSKADISKADVAVVAEPESEVIISPSDEFSIDEMPSASDDALVTEDGLDIFEDESFEDEPKPAPKKK
jgi:hypothetical protein